MTAGFVAFPAFKVVAGQARAVRPGMWVLSALSLAFFLFYPY
jgi:AGZA family xanthine/uracil permease-like MFS transporter